MNSDISELLKRISQLEETNDSLLSYAITLKNYARQLENRVRDLERNNNNNNNLSPGDKIIIINSNNPKEKKGTVTSVDTIKKRVKFRFDTTKRRTWRSLHNVKRIIDNKD